MEKTKRIPVQAKIQEKQIITDNCTVYLEREAVVACKQPKKAFIDERGDDKVQVLFYKELPESLYYKTKE